MPVIPKRAKSWWILYSIAYEPEIDSLPILPIKGKGHAPRVAITRKNPFHTRLRSEKIKHMQGADFKTHHYALKRDYDMMRAALLAVGVDMDSLTIVDQRAETAGEVFWKMNRTVLPNEVSVKMLKRVLRNQRRAALSAERRQYQF